MLYGVQFYIRLFDVYYIILFHRIFRHFYPWIVISFFYLSILLFGGKKANVCKCKKVWIFFNCFQNSSEIRMQIYRRLCFVKKKSGKILEIIEFFIAFFLSKYFVIETRTLTNERLQQVTANSAGTKISVFNQHILCLF